MNDLTRAYCQWILAQRLEGCVLTKTDKGNIVLASELLKGEVNFYDIDGVTVVELRLERASDGESAFFLHFELDDLVRAQSLFGEMAEVVYGTFHKSVRHVLLCCTCGVTTTFFSRKLNELARQFGIDYDFTAQPIEEAKANGSQYAAVLLAPQVGHQRKAVVEALPDTPVIELPGKIFGAYDAAAALRLVVDALSGTRSTSTKDVLPLARDYDRTKRVLALSYIHREDEPTLSYRVLDHGRIALSGMLVRRAFDLETMRDLAATLRVEGWKTSEFDAIGIAVPGIVDKGTVTWPHDGKLERFDLADRLSAFWKTKVYLDFNACAAAVGCYVSQDTYDDVVFHAQVVGVADGEQGYVIGGEPVVGRGGFSGHVGPLAEGYALEMGLDDAAWRVKGMRELVGRYLANVICTLAPQAIFVWCDLLPDMDELREELLKTLPAASIPELMGVADYDGCVLTGELSLCLRRLARQA